jgi:arylsulfatase A
MRNAGIWLHKWLAVCVVVLTVMGSAFGETKGSKPDIIIILADDMGYGDCTVNNPDSKILTPHIDQLAKEGLRFTDAHSASVTCTASRYGLLTGINPARTGVRNTLIGQGRPIIDEKEKTLASMLIDQGYATKMVGKWHLGFEMKKTGRRAELDLSKPLLGGPLDRGFDCFFGIHASPGSSPRVCIKGRHPFTESTDTKKGAGTASAEYVQEELAPRLCREVTGIIRAHAASKDKKPLFLYYASPIPHTPHVPVDKFKGKSSAGAYGDYMLQFDDEVRQINDVLKETGLDRNTILIFTSDNGASPGVVGKHDHKANGIFRGYKASAYEGGHRIPFIIRWPGKIRASSVSKTTINHTDIFATIAELLDVDLRKSYPGSAEDSHSFAPALFEPTKRFSRPVTVNSVKCIRMGDWKLVDDRKSGYELYNLEDDPSEQKNVSKDNPERKQQLVKLFEEFTANRRLKAGAK